LEMSSNYYVIDMYSKHLDRHYVTSCLLVWRYLSLSRHSAV